MLIIKTLRVNMFENDASLLGKVSSFRKLLARSGYVFSQELRRRRRRRRRSRSRRRRRSGLIGVKDTRICHSRAPVEVR